MTTSFGVAGVRSVVSGGDVDPEEAPWAWAGVRWEFEGAETDLEAMTGIIRFNLGRRLSDAMGFLFYRARSIDDGVKTGSVDLVLTFPVPG